MLVAQAARDDRNKIRQHTLVRELEKLAVFVGEGATIDVEAVDAVTTSAAESRVFELADAIIEGDRSAPCASPRSCAITATTSCTSCSPCCGSCATAIASGPSCRPGPRQKDIQADLRQPPWIAKQTIAQARRADPERVERALDLLAELDWQIRGGGRPGRRERPHAHRHRGQLGPEGGRLTLGTPAGPRAGSGGAGPQARGACLLAGGVVAVKRSVLGGLVDLGHQRAELGVDRTRSLDSTACSRRRK